jgi:hypothetical protein
MSDPTGTVERTLTAYATAFALVPGERGRERDADIRCVDWRQNRSFRGVRVRNGTRGLELLTAHLERAVEDGRPVATP